MIYLAGIVEDSIVDGPGIRTTFFCQGCSHHCDGCQNPETWPCEGGAPMDEKELAEIAMANPLNSGVTFSGGEPFEQAEGFSVLAKLLKKRGVELAAYSGYTFEELLEGTEAQKELLSNIDVLIDGKFEILERSLDLVFRGSRNQRVIDVPKSLETGTAVVITSGRWAGEW